MDIVSNDEIKREKEKARRLRGTHWWRNKIQQGTCYYCNRQVGMGELTMDHVVPLSRGGKSKKGNVVPCCKKCNNVKKYYTPAEILLQKMHNYVHNDPTSPKPSQE